MVAALIGAFLSVVLCISITPLREWTQELAVCRSAEEVVRTSSDSGTVRNRQGQPQATETTEMVCYYDGGDTIKPVGNDAAVLGGIGVSLLGGLLAGGLPVLASRSIRRRSS